MRSMTGFGVASQQVDGVQIDVQVASVNHRHCQVQLRCDVRDVALEDQIRSLVRQQLQRGAITVQVSVTEASDAGPDLDLLQSWWQPLAETAQRLGAPPPALESLLPLLPRRRAGPESEALSQGVMQTLGQALAACVQARVREGADLAEDLCQRHQQLLESIAAMQELAPKRLPQARQALQQRLQEALDAAIEPELLARECALLADRLDVGEELTRLSSHAQAFVELVKADDGEPQGKRLEFLLQELGREVNTMGSKSNDAELTAQVLQAKHVLEQCREQVANVW